MPEAKQKLVNNRRIYELAEDAQGYSNCEVIVAECDVEGPKVRLTYKKYMPILTDFFHCRISKVFLLSFLELLVGLVSCHISKREYKQTTLACTLRSSTSTIRRYCYVVVLHYVNEPNGNGSGYVHQEW